MIYKWLNTTRDLVYPPTCLLCDAPGRDDLDLCDGCRSELPWNDHSCAICAVPLPAGESGPCAECLKHPPPYNVAFAPLVYAPPVDFLLTRFKFQAQLSAGRVLAALLAQALTRFSGPRPDLLLPVPLHRSRLLRRGFNQAMVLARPAVARLDLNLSTTTARRSRRTRQQSRLDAGERRANLRGAFRITGDVRGLDIAILDDVVTTGRTAHELTRALKRAGGARVRVWALARASRAP